MSLSKNEIKLVKSLQNKKFRDLQQLFVVEGIKLVTELLEQESFKIKTVYVTSTAIFDEIKGIAFTHITEKELERMSGLKNPNKVLAVVEIPSETTINYAQENLILVLDALNDPGNLGTIIRTADWFGIETIIASEDTVDLFNPKVIQASMGAVYRIQFVRKDIKMALKHLKEHDFTLIGAALNGENLYQAKIPLKTALIMGSESHGIALETKNVLDQTLLIPQFGKTESLNVGMATGIILSHYKLINS